MNKFELIELLHQEVVPALGCTEPVAVALAVASAVKTAGGSVKKINVTVNPSIYKNGMAVGIPGFSLVGLNYASALGAVLANPEDKLEIFNKITREIGEKAIKLVENRHVSVNIDKTKNILYIEANVETDEAVGRCIIKNSYDNIVLTERNGVLISEQKEISISENKLNEKLSGLKIAQIVELVEKCTDEELLFLYDGVKMNTTLSKFGLSDENKDGLGIAHNLEDLTKSNVLGDTLFSRIMVKVASASESRMSGCPYSAMSSAGSGNHGLTTIIPVVEFAKHIKAEKSKLLKALAIAHTLNVYIKYFSGKLSATCGCGVAAATSASSAMVYLMGGNVEQMGKTIINMTANLTGMICDGGKIGCALKLATASNAAVMSAYLAYSDIVIPASNGICDSTPEKTIRNLGRVSKIGMKMTDEVILDIMLEKASSDAI
jgi:L-cysteine desulfidase